MESAYVGVDENGVITYISQDKPISEEIEFVAGAALPGFQNSHSHAFQYGMARKAERHAKGTKDDFWSWREAMYLCALSQDPDQLQEFHYLHHDKNGKP